MELTSIVTAVVIGSVVGALGWFLLSDGRTRPAWRATVMGVIAAVIGTVVGRAVGLPAAPASSGWNCSSS